MQSFDIATTNAPPARRYATRKVAVALPGGTLTIAWGEDNRIRMTGPATEAYRGSFEWGDFA